MDQVGGARATTWVGLHMLRTADAGNSEVVTVTPDRRIGPSFTRVPYEVRRSPVRLDPSGARCL
jgi:hypothetical protein